MTGAPTLTEARRTAAEAAGRLVAKTGGPITMCPHEVNGTDPVDRALAGAWIRGFAESRPGTVNFAE